MIAYNKTWLANLRLQQQVKRETQSGNISAAEYHAIAEKYPVGFYTPNIFVRIGLFILTCVIVLFADGLLSLMAAAGSIVETAGWSFFLGLISYVFLEVMISSNKHYRSGVDDALSFATGVTFSVGFAIMLHSYDDGTQYTVLAGLIFLLTIYFTLRFADMLAAAVCCISFFAFVFYYWGSLVANLTFVPFVLMAVSAAGYFAARRYSSKAALINYENCLVVAQIVSLVVLYCDGNYYIIDTLRDKIMHEPGATPFGSIFWVWTIFIPLVYISFGIKQKDVILLRTGLLLVTIAVLTFRNYYHLLPTDVMLTIAGILLLALVYAIMRYLKIPKHGFTLAEPDEVNALDNLKIESLIVAETFAHTPTAPGTDGTKFGGGDFGGGGSSGGF